MNIIQCHNYYQVPGGEDSVVEDERVLLESRGHRVTQFTRHNDDVKKLSSLRLAARTIWSRSAAKELETLVRKEQADVVHLHNTMPQISPAAYYAARRGGAAVVQTLHNYRLLCPKGTFFRDGEICEKCAGKAVSWPSVAHACYRDSRAGSVVLTVMGATHRLIRTYDRMVDAYVAASEFTCDKMLAAGLPKDRMHVKPNFIVNDPGIGTGEGGYALYLGRLSPEKGVDTLIAAWDKMPQALPLKIIGSGPMQDRVEALAQRHTHVQYLGFMCQPELGDVLRSASVLVLPSVNYEGFPKVIPEAYGSGLPIVASRLGSMQHAVLDGQTGQLFKHGDADDLARVMTELIRSPQRLASMRLKAREQYERRYNAEENYKQLITIYEQALSRRGVRTSQSA